MGGNYIFSFEKLLVWQKSMDLVSNIYRITKTFPKSEQFGIASQIRRASFSICNNIAEGSGKIPAKEKAHFTSIAYASALETINILIISQEIDLLPKNEYLELRNSLEEITSMLSGLRKSQLTKH